MNTFWLKIAGFAVVIFVLIILISKFTGSKSEPKPEPKTFQDVAEQDKREFLTEPKSEESAEQKPQLQPTEKQVPADMDTAKQITIYCSELSDIDKIEAERLLNVAVPGRSIGRLPMTGFKLMVDSCRQIIQKWPDSWYAYRAKQMLADMPERFHRRYRIPEDELDLSRFAKPRPGTKAFTIEKSD